MKGLTKLGQFLRKLRIDYLLTQNELAKKLGVSVAFYSAVETGRKPMPAELRLKIIQHYHLSDKQVSELDEAITCSGSDVKINMEELDDSTKELVACFARNFKDLEDDDKAKILEILNL